MADDREVLREIWDGKVPVSFQLAHEEVVSVEQPEPLYVSILKYGVMNNVKSIIKYFWPSIYYRPISPLLTYLVISPLLTY